MEWTPELKARVVKEYLDAGPTAENGAEIVAAISEGIEGSTVNGVRIILAKSKDEEGNKIYITKASGNKPSESKEKSTSKRVSKADAVDALVGVIEDNELNLDEDIINKLTGKAAVYFTELLTELTKKD